MTRKLLAIPWPFRQSASILALAVFTLMLFASPTRADLVFQNTTTGELADWLMSGINRLSTVSPPSPGTYTWKVVGAGDFSGDRISDLLFQNQQTGQLVYWEMNGGAFIRLHYINPSLPGPIDWRVATVTDIDGDGQSDIIFQNQSTGQLVYWLMNGENLRTFGFLPDPGSVNWKLVGSADLNRDGRKDLLFQHQVTGDLAFWLMNGTTFITYGLLPNPGSPVWRLTGSDDFNGDGKPDLLFQNQVTGDLVYWLLDGATITNINFINPSNPGSRDWTVVAIWGGSVHVD